MIKDRIGLLLVLLPLLILQVTRYNSNCAIFSGNLVVCKGNLRICLCISVPCNGYLVNYISNLLTRHGILETYTSNLAICSGNVVCCNGNLRIYRLILVTCNGHL